MSLDGYAPPVIFLMDGRALLVSYYDPLSIINRLWQLLSMVEAVEYTIHLLLGSQTTYALLPITSEQRLNVVAGIFGLFGWLILMVTIFLRYGDTDI